MTPLLPLAPKATMKPAMHLLATRIIAIIIMLKLSTVPLAHCFVRSSSLASRLANSQIRSSHRLLASVTGTVYKSPDEMAPTVKLFTKEGCTLCDKVKDVLVELRDEYPHSLEQVDITDADHSDWFSKYKYDIPVLHLENKFWIKHRTTLEEASEGLIKAREGTFQGRPGEPDAGAIERKQAEREHRS